MVPRPRRSCDRAAFVFGQQDLPLGSRLLRPRAEQELVRTVGEWAALEGHLAMRINNGAVRFGKRLVRFVRFWLKGDGSGISPLPPDMLVWHRTTGRVVAMEMKDGRGRMSPGQLKFNREVLSRGGIAVEIRSLADAQWAMRLAGESEPEMPPQPGPQERP